MNLLEHTTVATKPTPPGPDWGLILPPAFIALSIIGLAIAIKFGG